MKEQKKLKTYAQKINQEKRKSLLEEVSCAINQHDRFKKAYCFTPPNSAGGRRHYEKVNSFCVVFKYDGHLYKYDCYIHCSCKNVYYEHDFFVDRHAVDVRPFRKVQRELTAAIEAYDLKHSNEEV